MTFTTRPTLQGTFGMVSSTHWLASQSAMAELEAGGNAFDAAVDRRLRPARRRAAPQRPRRRGARRSSRPPSDPAPRVLCGPGAGAGGRDHRALTSPRPRPGARLGAAGRRRPGRRRRLAAAAARPRHLPLREVLAPAIGYAAGGHPLLAAGRATVAARAGAVQRALADLGRASGCRDGRRPEPGRLFANAAYADDPRAPGRRGRGRRRGPRARRSTRPGAPGARASSPRRSTRSRAAVPRLQRRGPRRAGHRRRHGGLLGDVGGAGDL